MMHGGRRVAAIQFGVSALALVAVIGTVGAVGLHRASQGESLRQAGQLTRFVGEGLAPEITDEVMAGDPAALQRLDEIVHGRVLRGPIRHVKLWTPDGRVVYSDEKRLIGRHFPPSEDLLEAERSKDLHAEVSPLDNAENAFDRPQQGSQLLEVYLPLWGPSGAEVIAETYQDAHLVAATSTHIWRSFVPVLLI